MPRGEIRQNAKDHKNDIKNYNLNKSSIPGATSSDPIVKAVADVEAQTVAVSKRFSYVINLLLVLLDIQP